MIIHAGGTFGFVPDAGRVFITNNKSADYHDSMDSKYFEYWFENDVLKRLEETSLITMNNASYHSRQFNKLPTGAWTKGEILEWLNKNNINISLEARLKLDLLKLVTEHSTVMQNSYVVDKLVARSFEATTVSLSL